MVGISFALPVKLLPPDRVTQAGRAASLPRDRYSTTMMASLVTALLAFAATVAFLMGAVPSALLALVAVLQLITVGCVLVARAGVAGRIATLQRLSESDPATGCLNRRGFQRALDEALASASTTHCDVALLAIDLDHFKRINDQFGHNVGDTVLFHLAAVLVDAVGDEGLVARLGGEEFSVLLPCADVENAGVVAERLMARVRAHQPTNSSRDAAITMSVGIAVEPMESTGDSASLRARADEALYMAKRSGRDRVLLWAPGVRSLATPAASMAAITQAPRRAGQPYVR